MQLEKIGPTSPYRIGDKLKVYIRDADISAGKPTCTFGRVVATNGKGHDPMLSYEDLHELPISRFNRFVHIDDVKFMPRKEHANLYETFINENGTLRLKK